MITFRASLTFCLIQAIAVAAAQEYPSTDLEIFAPHSQPTVSQFALFNDAAQQWHLIETIFTAELGRNNKFVPLDYFFAGPTAADFPSSTNPTVFDNTAGQPPEGQCAIPALNAMADHSHFDNIDDGLSRWGAKLAGKNILFSFTDPEPVSPMVGTQLGSGNSIFSAHDIDNAALAVADHELSFLPILGLSFQWGCSDAAQGQAVFATRARINQWAGYADLNTIQVDAVNGATGNPSSTTWSWDSSAKVGLMYNLSSSCFFDVYYDLLLSGRYSPNYSPTFTGDPAGYPGAPPLNINAMQRLTAESFTVAFHLMF